MHNANAESDGSADRLCFRLSVLLAVAVGCVFTISVGLPSAIWLGPLTGFGALVGCRCLLALRAGQRGDRDANALALANCWDLLAACLRGGLPVPTAVRIVASRMSGTVAEMLRHTAELIALGADPVEAWSPALSHPATAELARAARRTARSGAALAGVADALASEVRGAANDIAEARAQRASVAVAGPLALCFLPAFLCLGVIPVVIGLAARMMASW